MPEVDGLKGEIAGSPLWNGISRP